MKKLLKLIKHPVFSKWGIRSWRSSLLNAHKR